MSRNISALETEAREHGLEVIPAGKKLSKTDFEIALRDFYWARDHAGETMLEQVAPMLARNSKDLKPEEIEVLLQDGNNWVAQEKLDGARGLYHVLPTGNRITSRRISDKTYLMSENTANLPTLTEIVIPEEWMGAILDTEIMADRAEVNTGDTITTKILQATVALMNSAPEKSKAIQAEYGIEFDMHVFDVLRGKGGEDLRGEPYGSRCLVVEEFVQAVKEHNPGLKIHAPKLVSTGKKEYYEEITRQGGEGIMLKDMDAPYEGKGRPKAMYKMKKFIEVDAYVTGFHPAKEGKGWEGLVGDLMLSVLDQNGNERWIATVSNFTEEQRIEMSDKDSEGNVVLRPEWYGRIFEVRGQELSGRNLRMSHACVERPRPDKNQDECYFDYTNFE